MPRIDKSRLLAGERQEPYTAAEHAAAEGHEEEYARDVPRTCICVWQFDVHERRYVIIGPVLGCPWHSDQIEAAAERKENG
jgi:hypothetical protein